MRRKTRADTRPSTPADLRVILQSRVVVSASLHKPNAHDVNSEPPRRLCHGGSGQHPIN